MQSRPRVLIIAESANPEQVSVPLVGWSHATAIARRCEALIVTQIRNRDPFLCAGLVEGKDFEVIDTEWLAIPLGRLNGLLRRVGFGWTVTTALRAVSVYAFERAICRRFHADLRSGRFDVVHRVIPLSPTIPSPSLSAACWDAGVPFVLGPLNGGVSWPADFRRAQRAEGEWLSYVRSLHKLLPGYRATLRRASAIIAGSRDTLAQIPERFRSKCVYIVENAIDPRRFTMVNDHFIKPPLRVAFVGRLVPYKGCDMMLDALAPLIAEGVVEVNVYGDGPERGSLDAICARHGIADGVRFHGWVKHESLQDLLVQDHLFVFPSVREFGGGVVIEAMALGLVPVVVDYGGPGELVTPDSGIAIPMGPRESIVRGVREAVTSLVSDLTRLRRMREAGLARVAEHFTWDAKVSKTLEVYRWVMNKRDSSPESDPGFVSDAASPLRGSPVHNSPGSGPQIASRNVT